MYITTSGIFLTNRLSFPGRGNNAYNIHQNKWMKLVNDNYK